MSCVNGTRSGRVLCFRLKINVAHVLGLEEGCGGQGVGREPEINAQRSDVFWSQADIGSEAGQVKESTPFPGSECIGMLTYIKYMYLQSTVHEHERR